MHPPPIVHINSIPLSVIKFKTLLKFKLINISNESKPETAKKTGNLYVQESISFLIVVNCTNRTPFSVRIGDVLTTPCFMLGSDLHGIF